MSAEIGCAGAAGTHDFAASDAEFEQITSYFTPPDTEDGFAVIPHQAGQISL
jgi:hypothetical protein